MSFPDFLVSKKIDAARFAAAEPDVFKEWADLFEQMHPNSFTLQKLNLINAVRRKYWLGLDPPGTPSGDTPNRPALVKPKIS